MLHEVNFEALFPLEVDDEQIFEHEIGEPLSVPSPQSARTPDGPRKQMPLNLTSGFNLHSLVFFKGARIAFTPGNCDWEHRTPPETRLTQLRELLDEIRYMLDDIPSSMRQWASWSNGSSPNVPDSTSMQTSEGWERSDIAVRKVDGNSKILAGQLQIMRANLHGTHLWVQSALLDRIDVILHEKAQRLATEANQDTPTADLKASWLEREDVCRQMLHLLHSMPYAYQEPNGLYFVSISLSF